MTRSRYFSLALVGALVGALVYAAPPTVTIPPEVRPTGDYAIVQPGGDAVAVVYVGLSGADPFPSMLLKDPRSFVLPVRGLKDGVYRFAAVGSSKDGELTRVDFVVTVGAAPTPGPTPGPTPDPKPVPKPGYYFALVRPDGPADPGFTNFVQDANWQKLRDQGHTVKDFTLKEACAAGFCPPPGTTLPAVITLQFAADGKTGAVVREFRPLPTRREDILKLPEGIK